MKLRNKKTGEIVEVESCNSTAGTIGLFFYEGRECDRAYNSLSELNEEWEDIPEEPKDFWYIDADGKIKETTYLTYNDKFDLENFGNLFENKEEAEKAVEKLKAWKRLKDGGFKFKDFARLNDQTHIIRATSNESWTNLYDDLDLLFGGEK